MQQSVLLVLLFVALCAGFQQKSWYFLSAPWTPFKSDGSLNLAQVELDAAFQAKQGVTAVWAVGGMGQWSTLTLNERKALAEAWVTHGKANGLQVLIHVGSQCIADSIDLAKHAQSIGADGIAVIPPWAPERPKDIQTLVLIMSLIANSVTLPFYYYHIPGTTGLNYKMADFLNLAKGNIPTLAGIKYVSPDLEDFAACVQMDGGKYNIMWAQEPKLQALPFGATSFVLAESYYAPYLLPVLNAFASGNNVLAQQMQARLNDLQSLVVGGSGKYVMKMLGIDLGPPRLPQVPLDPNVYIQVEENLRAWGFFNTTQPAYSRLTGY